MYSNQTLTQLLCTGMRFLAILALSACSPNFGKPTPPSTASTTPQQQPATHTTRTSNTAYHTGTRAPQLSNPVQRAAPHPTETVNAEALDQLKKQLQEVESNAAGTLSSAIYAMWSGLPPGELNKVPYIKWCNMHADFIASDDAIERVNELIKPIPEALQQAKAAQDKEPKVARIETILATANVVQAAAQSMSARLKAEYAVSERNPFSAKATAARTPARQQAIQAAQAAAEKAIAAAKPVIQQALQAAQAAAEKEKEIVIPGSLEGIFLNLANTGTRDTTRIAQKYLAKIEADKQAVEALSENLHYELTSGYN